MRMREIPKAQGDSDSDLDGACYLKHDDPEGRLRWMTNSVPGPVGDRGMTSTRPLTDERWNLHKARDGFLCMLRPEGQRASKTGAAQPAGGLPHWPTTMLSSHPA